MSLHKAIIDYVSLQNNCRSSILWERFPRQYLRESKITRKGQESRVTLGYRKFPNKGAGHLGKTLGGAIIREGIFSPSSGFLQNENRAIFG